MCYKVIFVQATAKKQSPERKDQHWTVDPERGQLSPQYYSLIFLPAYRFVALRLYSIFIRSECKSIASIESDMMKIRTERYIKDLQVTLLLPAVLGTIPTVGIKQYGQK